MYICAYRSAFIMLNMVESTNDARPNWSWYRSQNQQITLDLMKVLIPQVELYSQI